MKKARNKGMLDIAVEVLLWEECTEELVELVRCSARLTLESQGEEHVGLGIALAGDDYVQELNRRYRGKDQPTDVLSFPLWEEGDAPEVPLGDIIISVPRARRQAQEREHSLQIELIHLVAHGVLHLLGWCHDSAVGEERMWEIQEQVAAKYHQKR